MILYNTKYLQLKSTKSKNGGEWIYAHRPNSSEVVVIVPIIEKTKILFLIEERPPIIAEDLGKYSVAVPAGLVGDERKNESTIDAIRAELLEESGLIADKIEIKARKVASSPGCVSETFTIAFAYIDDYKIMKEPISDDGVIIDREIVEIKDIDSWLKRKQEEGILLTSQTLAALYYLNKEEL